MAIYLRQYTIGMMEGKFAAASGSGDGWWLVRAICGQGGVGGVS